MKTLSVILAACAAIAIAGCGSSSDPSTGSSESSAETATTESSAETATNESTPPTTQSKEADPTAEKTKPKVTVPKGPPPKQLVIKEIEEGSGAAAEPGDEVTVQYVGAGYRSKEEFDSSWSRNEPFTFSLGSGLVILGWDEGVKGMKVGGRRELLIPSQLGYGHVGSLPAIGHDEALVFVIDLLAVK